MVSAWNSQEAGKLLHYLILLEGEQQIVCGYRISFFCVSYSIYLDL